MSKNFITDYFIPVDAPPPPQVRRRVQSGTPDFRSNQGYLYPNMPGNNGIDAEYSWTVEGGDGEGITIYDIEYSWNINHEDLDASIPSITNPGDEGSNPLNDLNHGTAVLGEMVGTNNGLGVKGISHGAQAKVVPEMTINGGGNRADAIIRAVYDGKPGDVILLEMQTWVCGTEEYGPAEEDQAVFEATKVAVANKRVVVAAAGNGNVNLDDLQCEGKYDRTNPDRDSGAIIVGAGGSGVDGCSPARQKLGFLTYGSRVDVHGWGECVWTTGQGEYSDPTNPADQNKWYMGGFSGTSSASPFIAAAVANIQGIAMKHFGSPLEPKEVRKLLTETGLLQEGLDADKNIGPLVNLRNAIVKLLDDEIMDDKIITIQAESYENMQGVVPEDTVDEGGGMNVGSIDTGDWMSYPEVDIPSAGTYTIEYRVASESGGGVLQFEKAGGTLYGTIDIPTTWDWQAWVTISHTVNLEAGPQHFGIAVPVGGWNLNWFRITDVN